MLDSILVIGVGCKAKKKKKHIGSRAYIRLFRGEQQSNRKLDPNVGRLTL